MPPSPRKLTYYLLYILEQLEFHIHHAKEVARVAKIVSLLDAKTGKVTKKSPRCLVSKQTAIVEVCYC